MKKILFITLIGWGALTSCDKVGNPYPNLPSTELDYSLYPNGGEAEYAANEWPTFAANTNTNRNLLIEDFTGHLCNNCPPAAEEAHNLMAANPGRVYVSSVHTGPLGAGSLQAVQAPDYLEDFTNATSNEIGLYFGGNWPGSPFAGNPYGALSRVDAGNGFPIMHPSSWGSSVSALLAANELKVNIQAETNYFTATNGLFLHTEIEVLDQSLTNELKVVVELLEDTLEATQLFPSPIYDSLTYVHHDILRGTIDGRTFGQELDSDHLDANGKYYFNYSYALPSEYDPANMHLLIFVRDAVTEEIYHVIKKDIQ